MNDVSSLNYRHLMQFLEIAKSGTVSAASEVLQVAQPSLSINLKKLERHLGTELFVRERGRLRLTPAGERVRKHAAEIERVGALIVGESAGPMSIPPVVVRMGASPSIAKDDIYRVVLPLLRIKRVHLAFEEVSTFELVDRLEAGRIDAALTDQVIGATRVALRQVKMKDREIVAVTGVRAKFRLRFPLCLQEKPLILGSAANPIRRQAELFLEQNNLSYSVLGEFDDLALQRRVAREGLGIAILPRSTVRDSLKAAELKKLGGLPGVRSDLWLNIRRRSEVAGLIGDKLRVEL